MNKLMKMATVVVGVGAMLVFAGCGGGSPESVAKKVVSCIKDADFKSIDKYATGDFAKGIGMMEGLMKSASPSEVERAKEKFQGPYEIGVATIEGDEATIPVSISGREKWMRLVKINGDWKVEEFNFKN